MRSGPTNDRIQEWIQLDPANNTFTSITYLSEVVSNHNKIQEYANWFATKRNKELEQRNRELEALLKKSSAILDTSDGEIHHE